MAMMKRLSSASVSDFSHSSRHGTLSRNVMSYGEWTLRSPTRISPSSWLCFLTRPVERHMGSEKYAYVSDGLANGPTLFTMSGIGSCSTYRLPRAGAARARTPRRRAAGRSMVTGVSGVRQRGSGDGVGWLGCERRPHGARKGEESGDGEH